MAELIDYAGLFPPAAFSMRDAAVEYQRWRDSEYAWMVGRFVCPVARLSELARESEAVASGAWQISVLAGDPLERDLDSITAFLDETGSRFDVPSLEVKISSIANLESCLEGLETVEDGVTAYFELPVDEDLRGLVTALAGSGHGAKIRTGGVTPDLFPSPEQVARFIVACRDAQVPFKATAGLHHPVRRADANLGCRMHGFFNVFLAATAAAARNLSVEAVASILRTEKADAFSFADDHCRVLDHALTTKDVIRGRRQAIAFGSCSIAQPVADLTALSLLPLGAPA